MIIPERINALIETIRKSGRINMPSWQERGLRQENGVISRTLEELHECGNKACIGGHLALMPEFWAAGGVFNPRSGQPCIKERVGALAVYAWLHDCVKDMYAISFSEDPEIKQYFEREYTKMRAVINGAYQGRPLSGWADWNTQDAIRVLEILRDQPDLSVEEFITEIQGKPLEY